MSRDMSQELRSCPFCGGKASIGETSHSTFVWMVACDECDASSDCGVTIEEVTDYWNRRPTPASTEALAALERLRVAAVAYEADPVDNRDRPSSWSKLGEMLEAITLGVPIVRAALSAPASSLATGDTAACEGCGGTGKMPIHLGKMPRGFVAFVGGHLRDEDGVHRIICPLCRPFTPQAESALAVDQDERERLAKMADAQWTRDMLNATSARSSAKATDSIDNEEIRRCTREHHEAIAARCERDERDWRKISEIVRAPTVAE